MSETSGRGEILLAIDSATVMFGPLCAVRNVSLSLGPGALLGLIGPNGAGKTTLLRAVAGLQPTTRGSIRVMDQLVNGDRDVLRYIGFTPDTPPMYEQLTVRQFLQFIARGYELSSGEAEERIDFWLEKVWLTEKKDQKIKQLSRGMRQRVGIARTLLPNPVVVLLDEPAAGLDPGGRAQFRQLLCSLREQGKTLIVSSHILADLEEYCTHIGIMSAGQMVRLGTVAQVSQAAHGERVRYTILLAHEMPNLRNLLIKIPDAADIEIEGERITLEYPSGRESAARLLAELMKLGLAVASFTPNAATLEEAYLREKIHQVD
jgi:ABC-2 type transport system ATP-binding protein